MFTKPDKGGTYASFIGLFLGEGGREEWLHPNATQILKIDYDFSSAHSSNSNLNYLSQKNTAA